MALTLASPCELASTTHETAASAKRTSALATDLIALLGSSSEGLPSALASCTPRSSSVSSVASPTEGSEQSHASVQEVNFEEKGAGRGSYEAFMVSHNYLASWPELSTLIFQSKAGLQSPFSLTTHERALSELYNSPPQELHLSHVQTTPEYSQQNRNTSETPDAPPPLHLNMDSMPRFPTPSHSVSPQPYRSQNYTPDAPPPMNNQQDSMPRFPTPDSIALGLTPRKTHEQEAKDSDASILFSAEEEQPSQFESLYTPPVDEQPHSPAFFKLKGSIDSSTVDCSSPALSAYDAKRSCDDSKAPSLLSIPLYPLSPSPSQGSEKESRRKSIFGGFKKSSKSRPAMPDESLKGLGFSDSPIDQPFQDLASPEPQIIKRPRRASLSEKFANLFHRKKEAAPPLPPSPNPETFVVMTPDMGRSPRASSIFSKRLSRSKSSPDLKAGKKEITPPVPSLKALMMNNSMDDLIARPSTAPKSPTPSLKSRSSAAHFPAWSPLAVEIDALPRPQSAKSRQDLPPLPSPTASEMSQARSFVSASDLLLPNRSMSKSGRPDLHLDLRRKGSENGSAFSYSPTSSAKGTSIFDSSMTCSTFGTEAPPSPMSVAVCDATVQSDEIEEVLNEEEVEQVWVRRGSLSSSERSSSPVSCRSELAPFQPSLSTRSARSSLSSVPMDSERRSTSGQAFLPSASTSRFVADNPTRTLPRQDLQHRRRRSSSSSESPPRRLSFSGSESSSDDSESEDDVPLGQKHPDAVKLQKAKRGRERKRREKSPENKAVPKKNPFNFQSVEVSLVFGLKNDVDELFKMATKAVKKPGQKTIDPSVQQKKAQRRVSSPIKDFNGHSLLPQTDESVRKRSRSRNCGEAHAILPPFVSNAVLAISDDETPLVSLSRAATTRSSKKDQKAEDLSRRKTTSTTHRSHKNLPPLATHITPFRHPSSPLETARTPSLPQHVYLQDLQHRSNIRLLEASTPSDILRYLVRKGRAQPTWTIFEVWPHYGIERIIGLNETITSCTQSWPKEGQVLLLAKECPLATAALKTHASTSNQTLFNEPLRVMENAKHKWNKRWLTFEDGHLSLTSSEKVSRLRFLSCVVLIV